jgi:hypothetical protein
MNFRLFLLLAAMAAFGALWSSDGRYQADQVALARAERAQSRNIVVATFDRLERRPSAPTEGWSPTAAAANGQFVARVCGLLAAQSARVLERLQPAHNTSDDRIQPEVLFGRAVIAWSLGLDPGNRLGVLSDVSARARIVFEERLCLLRFRGRQAAYFASRRIGNYVREQLDGAPRTSRTGRIVIREIPIEESQAPPAAGRQTR